MLLTFFLHAVVALAARFGLRNPLISKLAGLDFSKDLFHLGFGCLGDDTRAPSEIAVLGGVGDAVAHAGDALFIHQVDDQLYLVKALEIGHLGRVTRLSEGFEPSAYELGDTTAEDGLLTKQVSLGFFGECGLDDAGTRPTDCIGV